MLTGYSSSLRTPSKNPFFCVCVCASRPVLLSVGLMVKLIDSRPVTRGSGEGLWEVRDLPASQLSALRGGGGGGSGV